jgi:hypothetical protein
MSARGGACGRLAGLAGGRLLANAHPDQDEQKG